MHRLKLCKCTFEGHQTTTPITLYLGLYITGMKQETVVDIATALFTIMQPSPKPIPYPLIALIALHFPATQHHFIARWVGAEGTSIYHPRTVRYFSLRMHYPHEQCQLILHTDPRQRHSRTRSRYFITGHLISFPVKAKPAYQATTIQPWSTASSHHVVCVQKSNDNRKTTNTITRQSCK